MKIYSLLKNSFNDYPGKIASVVFSPMCNFRCWYCHNYDIITIDEEHVSHTQFFSWLESKQGEIDAVVISGGEPTLQTGLTEFIKKIKRLGFLVKLDTNGTNPEIVKKLIKGKLVDFIAMDIKAPLKKYEGLICTGVNVYTILESINIIKRATLDKVIECEFRTTISPSTTKDDIIEIATLLVGKDFDYAIQQYNPQNETQPKAYAPAFLIEVSKLIQKEVKNLKLRI